jgi:type IV pilus assembly protein PilB
MEREKILGEVQIPAEKFAKLKKEVTSIPELAKEIEQFLAVSATELVGMILAGAICLDASDIHVEPEETKAKLRIRLDGVLHDVMDLQIKTYRMILSRIKLLSGLKLNVMDRPQDGRFTILIPAQKEQTTAITIEIRASTLPAEYGESIVLRLLNPKNLIEIEALGLRKDLIQIFQQEIKRPNGMIVVTGPTGSGKTTTLYAILKKINDPEIKIITIEDPVEYHLQGLSQTQVDPAKGYTFAAGLRSIMRQDPDVILVGELEIWKQRKSPVSLL